MKYKFYQIISLANYLIKQHGYQLNYYFEIFNVIFNIIDNFMIFKL